MEARPGRGGAPAIDLLKAEEREAFFAYLNEHLADNGRDGMPLFQPMSRSAARIPEEKIAAFDGALDIAIGRPGWRRCLVAKDGDGAIVGHVDVRARPEGAAAHRVLLGMGVRRDHRGRGLGRQLVEAVRRWTLANTDADWIDLEVLSQNEPARRLYGRCGFVATGEIADMFRIDGAALAYTFMSLPLRRDAAPA